MTDKVKKCKDFLLNRGYRKNRSFRKVDVTAETRDLSEEERIFIRFERAANDEKPIFYESDDFGFNRCNTFLPEIEAGEMLGNVTVDYETFLSCGLNGLKEAISRRVPDADDEAKRFYDLALRYLRVCSDLVRKWRDGAEKAGRERLAAALAVVPENGATTYYDALVAIKFLHYALRLDDNKHLTLGRFDRYMLPYADESIRRGATINELIEDTELFRCDELRRRSL
ncbi:MAG: pyruvate formate lyase family protein [Christensenellales bacterium]